MTAARSMRSLFLLKSRLILYSDIAKSFHLREWFWFGSEAIDAATGPFFSLTTKTILSAEEFVKENLLASEEFLWYYIDVEFLTTQQAAKRLGVSDVRVRQLVREGRLPATL